MPFTALEDKFPLNNFKFLDLTMTRPIIPSNDNANMQIVGHC